MISQWIELSFLYFLKFFSFHGEQQLFPMQLAMMLRAGVAYFCYIQGTLMEGFDVYSKGSWIEDYKDSASGSTHLYISDEPDVST